MNEISLRKDYEAKAELYARLGDEVLYILKQKLKELGIPIHEITARVKPFDSFIDKARRKEYDAPFEEISDICGLRVICLFLSDLQRIGEVVESSFIIQTKDDKVYSKPEEAFGYLSVHYVGSLPAHFTGPRYDGLHGLRFEIQLRTIAMHAWATISHYLDYKSTVAVPSPLRKDFNALSALFYIADNHFEIFFRSSRETRQIAEAKAEHPSEIGKEEINLDTLGAYLKKKYRSREHGRGELLTQLVEELQCAGYMEIDQLDVALKRSEKAFSRYEKEHPPANAPRFADIGVVRSSLTIANETYLLCRNDLPSEEMIQRYREYRQLIR